MSSKTDLMCILVTCNNECFWEMECRVDSKALAWVDESVPECNTAAYVFHVAFVQTEQPLCKPGSRFISVQLLRHVMG